MTEDEDGGGGGGGEDVGGVGGGGGGVGGGGDDGGAGGIDDDRRTARHHGKHHKMAPPNRWSSIGPADGRSGASIGHHHRHDNSNMLVTNRNGTAAAARASSPPHVLHHAAAAPDSMCYTTNEVLVIIAVTCFLNFAFILLIMTCVHCFTDPSHHKKFGTVAYAELGDELFDTDMIDGDTVTLLNPTRSQDACNDYSYEKKSGYNEYDLESCAPYQGPMHDHQCKSRMKSEEDLFLFE